MDKRIFKQMMEFLSSVYPKVQLSVDVLNSWYECLKDLDEKSFQNTVIEWAKENRYPPTISELRNACKMNQIDEEWQ